MRIELKDENQEEPKQIDENDIHNKHESDLTKKEKRQLEKEKLAGMGLGAKLGYIWTYYKPQMAAIVGVIVLIFAAKDIYDNAQIETALTMMVIDSYGMNQAGAEEAVENILGIQDDPYQIVTVDESLRTEGDGAALESYSQMSFTTKVAARAIDVLVGSEIYIDSFENKEEYFANLRDLLPEDVFEKLGDPEDPYSISITSQELASELEVAYEPIKISILVNSEHTENAVTWISALVEMAD